MVPELATEHCRVGVSILFFIFSLLLRVPAIGSIIVVAIGFWAPIPRFLYSYLSNADCECIQRHLDEAELNARRNMFLLRAGENSDPTDPRKPRVSRVRIQFNAISVSPIQVTKKRSILKACSTTAGKRNSSDFLAMVPKADGDFGDKPPPNLLDGLFELNEGIRAA